MAGAELRVELDREADGRWIAEVPAIAGALVYGASPEQAISAVRRLAADAVEDRKRHGEPVPPVEPDAGALTMLVSSRVATVVLCEGTSLLVGYVDGLPGAHTQAASLDELYLNLGEVIGLVTEESSAPDISAEERLSAREN